MGANFGPYVSNWSQAGYYRSRKYLGDAYETDGSLRHFLVRLNMVAEVLFHWYYKDMNATTLLHRAASSNSKSDFL